MRTKAYICAAASLVVLWATASKPDVVASVGNPTLEDSLAYYGEEEPDDDFCHLFSGNTFLSSVAGSFWNCAFQTNDEYSFSKLNKLRKTQDGILIKAYDTIHPNQQLAQHEKAYRMVEELEEALDLEGAITTNEMNKGISVQYFFSRYKVIALSNEMLQQDAKFREEIEAWQDLHGLLDGICGSITSMSWFGGSGETGAVMGTYEQICQCRLNDLQRLSGKMNAEDKPSSFKLDTLGEIMMRKIEEVVAEVCTPEQVKDVLRETGVDRYKALWEDMRGSKDRLMQSWNKWIQVRHNLSNSNSMESAAMLTDDLVNIVESCNI